MTQAAWTHDGKPVDAASISSDEWERLKQAARLGDFVMPCCKAPAVLKTSINGLPFFAHLSDECSTAPETKWHKSGKAVVMAALTGMGIENRDEVPGRSPSGGKLTCSFQSKAAPLPLSYNAPTNIYANSLAAKSDTLHQE